MTVGLVVSFGGVVLAILAMYVVVAIMTGHSPTDVPPLASDLQASLSRAELAAKHAHEEIARLRASLPRQR